LWPRWTYGVLLAVMSVTVAGLFTGVIGVDNPDAGRQLALFLGVPLLVVLAVYFALARASARAVAVKVSKDPATPSSWDARQAPHRRMRYARNRGVSGRG